MATQSVSVRTSCFIGFLLVALTVLTVGISFAELDTHWHVAAGLSIGAVKAVLVVLFFMQAIVSPRLTWIVILAACAWVVIFVSLTFTDFLSRSLMPFAPGH